MCSVVDRTDYLDSLIDRSFSHLRRRSTDRSCQGWLFCQAGKGKKMYMKILIAVMAFSYCTVSIADESFTSTYGSLVDGAGNISLPKNFRSNWVFLGTWSIAKKDVERISEASGHGAAGLHNVYTQRGVAEYYQQNGKFPDGAAIIKELLKATTAPMTTGTVSRGIAVEGWFILVKDREGRFI